ncbi:hypothetical protein Zmor_020513 [Zophobas morio]|uniref:Uncharacterized protein n=1 Tax=Zophobas morio TaxID=2755281 RepID=A0AA38I7P0_9CUCU|nr:hypothetical protein Zmor_020513 [Zophobas morio]
MTEFHLFSHFLTLVACFSLFCCARFSSIVFFNQRVREYDSGPHLPKPLVKVSLKKSKKLKLNGVASTNYYIF